MVRNSEIVAFIESIEPDYSYKGTDGTMRMLVENAYNMEVIADALHEGIYDSIKEKAKKFYEWILAFVKKFVAKIKGFFAAVLNKVKYYLAKALKKIANLAIKMTGDATKTKSEITFKGCDFSDIGNTEADKMLKDAPSRVVDYLARIDSSIMNIDLGDASVSEYRKINDLGREDLETAIFGLITPGVSNASDFTDALKKVAKLNVTVKIPKGSNVKKLLTNYSKRLEQNFKFLFNSSSKVNEVIVQMGKGIEQKATKTATGEDRKGDAYDVAFAVARDVVSILSMIVTRVQHFITSAYLSSYAHLISAAIKGIYARAFDSKEDKDIKRNAPSIELK